MSLLALLAALLVPAPTHGIAMYYHAGAFASVARVRHMHLDPHVAGYAATPDCGRIGQYVAARFRGGGWQTFQVVDCQNPVDPPLKRGVVFEVNYDFAATVAGFVGDGRTPVTVWYR